ncbi:DNA alkylation repair protein [Neolewinella persica]|uniref:DNA alkylation repair protein n=1 Tax=Neolewinella persica TaxID=70998 RepID=UPI000380DBEC|nr:DNA alkylation repair protein [Neolewinella persica]
MAYKQLKLWFDADLATLIAEKIKPIYPKFDTAAFVQTVQDNADALELKDRVELIADSLEDNLPDDYPKQLAILMQILGPPNPNETGMFKEYYWLMPVAKFVEKYGLDHFADSVAAMVAITQRSTAEYTIRPYLEKYPKAMLKQMAVWAKADSFHLRRLASEGGRPKLPWAPKLQQFIDDPTPLFPILSTLKDDPKKFVQKSVANCLNDILKDNEALGRELIESWLPAPGKERKWIIKHALRNQLKAEKAWAEEIVANL